MGIHYLTTFVEKHFTGWKKTLLKGKLIVDGHSLFYAILEELSKGNGSYGEIYGGDYVSIARYIDRFFKKLLEAGINPFVVLDGVNPDNKADTIAERRKARLKAVINLFRDETSDEAPPNIGSELESDRLQRSGKKKSTERKLVKPFLLVDVMINSIKRVLGDDHLFVADSDADVDVACLAVHHQCPVLSQDGDFYAFPLLYGYIPYSKFHWRNASNGIYGELYSYQLFCQQFGIHDASLLTVIPVIVGNDTIPPLDETLLTKIMPGDAYNIGIVKIENAVKFVASFTTFDTCLTWLRHQKLFSIVKSVQDSYHDYFYLPLFKPRRSLATSLYCKDGSHLPEFILKKHRTRDTFTHTIDALRSHKVEFTIGVEDIMSESSCRLIGVPIRKAIYGILFGSDVCILENHRCHCAESFEALEIKGITHVTYNGKEIPLPTLKSCGSDVDVEYGKKILFGVLNVIDEDFKNIPQDYRLLLAITRYWYKYCTIERKEVLLKSFILLLQLSKENILEKRRSIEGGNTTAPFRKASFAHAFAQWQLLYRDVECLNTFLQMPLELPSVSNFLECSYLYSLVQDVMNVGDLKVIERYHLSLNTYQMYFALITKEQ